MPDKNLLDVFSFLKGAYQPLAPVSLFFGTYVVGSETMPKRAEIIKTVEVLRAKGVDAVPFFHKDASDPAKLVVTETGIQTPFIPADKALITARQLVDILQSAKVGVRGFIYPIYNEQLPLPLEKQPSKDEEFIEKQILFAYDNASPFSAEQMKRRDSSISSLWTGGNLGALPFTVGVSGNSLKGGEVRAVTYASPDPEVAKDFCGGVGKFNYARAYAPVKDIAYAFLYEFAPSDTQRYFKDFGLENMGVNPLMKASDNPYYETPVFPKLNDLKNIYLVMKKEDVSLQFFKVPKAQEWDDFMKMHQPVSKGLKGYLKERVLRQKADGGKTYTVFNNEIASKDYADLSEQKTYEILQNICDNSMLKPEENPKQKTTLKCLTDVRMNAWGITSLPSDMKNLYIEGAFEVRDNPNLRLDKSSLPVAKFGVKTSDAFKGMFEAGLQMASAVSLFK